MNANGQESEKRRVCPQIAPIPQIYKNSRGGAEKLSLTIETQKAKNMGQYYKKGVFHAKRRYCE